MKGVAMVGGAMGTSNDSSKKFNVLGIVIRLFVLLLVIVVFLFFWAHGGFAGNVDKNYFTNIRSSGLDGTIEFKNASNLVSRDIKVSAERIKVLIDSSLEETAVSATPKLTDRIFGETSRIFDYDYDARSVIVWVQNEEEKKAWEEYIESIIERHQIWEKFKTTRYVRPGKVIPNR